MNSITNDLRKKTNEELTEIVSKLKLQLLEIRFSASSGETEKQANASEIRKTIARALTIINERELKIIDKKKVNLQEVENGKK